jgi:hypothetical protein
VPTKFTTIQRGILSIHPTVKIHELDLLQHLRVPDLPLLPKGIGIIENGDAVTSKHLSSLKGSHQAYAAFKPLFEVKPIRTTEAHRHNIFVGTNDKVGSLTKINIELVVKFVNNIMGDKVVRDHSRRVSLADSVEKIFTPAGDLKDVVADLDGSCLNEAVIITDLGSGVNSQPDSVSKVWGMEQHSITLSMPIVPGSIPSLDVRLAKLPSREPESFSKCRVPKRAVEKSTPDYYCIDSRWGVTSDKIVGYNDGDRIRTRYSLHLRTRNCILTWRRKMGYRHGICMIRHQ